MTRLLLCTFFTVLGIADVSAQDHTPPMPTPPTPTIPTSAPITDACADPCPIACPTRCGPRLKVVIPQPIITFRKCGSKLVEASCPSAPCQVQTPYCPPTCQTGCYGGTAPSSGPRMMTVMVPYTYYVQVPTYGMVPTASYGAAPVAYGAAPVAYGAAPVAYGAAPAPAPAPVAYGAQVPTYGMVPTASYGAAPVAYGAAPVAYGAAPAPAPAPVAYGAAPSIVPVYGAPPADDCKKQLGEISGKVEKLQTDLVELKTFAINSKMQNEIAFVETVNAIKRHEDRINALKKIAAEDALKGIEPDNRGEKIKSIEEEMKKKRLESESKAK